MIGYLKGNIKYKGRGYIVIDVNSVGYKVEVGKNFLFKEDQTEVEIFVYPDLSDRGTRLFGFGSPSEVQFFERLKGINGVGPKAALSIISSSNFDTLVSVIDSGDSSFLSSIPGIGKKTAERIILDLRGKLSDVADTDSDIFETLSKLGYSRKEIESIYNNIKYIEPIEMAIKEALKLLRKQ